MSPGDPWQPPAQSWRPPPAVARRRPLREVALYAVPAALVGMFAFGFYLYATHDRLELLESVHDAAERACGTAVQALEAPSGDRMERIRRGNAALRALVADMRALGHDTLADDHPAEDWLADWARLERERASFAERLATDPAARFEVPLTPDGYPITERMTVAAGAECERAIALAATP